MSENLPVRARVDNNDFIVIETTGGRPSRAVLQFIGRDGKVRQAQRGSDLAEFNPFTSDSRIHAALLDDENRRISMRRSGDGWVLDEEAGFITENIESAKEFGRGVVRGAALLGESVGLADEGTAQEITDEEAVESINRPAVQGVNPSDPGSYYNVLGSAASSLGMSFGAAGAVNIGRRVGNLLRKKNFNEQAANSGENLVRAIRNKGDTESLEATAAAATVAASNAIKKNGGVPDTKKLNERMREFWGNASAEQVAALVTEMGTIGAVTADSVYQQNIAEGESHDVALSRAMWAGAIAAPAAGAAGGYGIFGVMLGRGGVEGRRLKSAAIAEAGQEFRQEGVQQAVEQTFTPGDYDIGEIGFSAGLGALAGYTVGGAVPNFGRAAQLNQIAADDRTIAQNELRKFTDRDLDRIFDSSLAAHNQEKKKQLKAMESPQNSEILKNLKTEELRQEVFQQQRKAFGEIAESTLKNADAALAEYDRQFEYYMEYKDSGLTPEEFIQSKFGENADQAAVDFLMQYDSHINNALRVAQDNDPYLRIQRISAANKEHEERKKRRLTILKEQYNRAVSAKNSEIAQRKLSEIEAVEPGFTGSRLSAMTKIEEIRYEVEKKRKQMQGAGDFQPPQDSGGFNGTGDDLVKRLNQNGLNPKQVSAFSAGIMDSINNNDGEWFYDERTGNLYTDNLDEKIAAFVNQPPPPAVKAKQAKKAAKKAVKRAKSPAEIPAESPVEIQAESPVENLAEEEPVSTPARKPAKKAAKKAVKQVELTENQEVEPSPPSPPSAPKSGYGEPLTANHPFIQALKAQEEAERAPSKKPAQKKAAKKPVADEEIIDETPADGEIAENQAKESSEEEAVLAKIKSDYEAVVKSDDAEKIAEFQIKLSERKLPELKRSDGEEYYSIDIINEEELREDPTLTEDEAEAVIERMERIEGTGELIGDTGKALTDYWAQQDTQEKKPEKKEKADKKAAKSKPEKKEPAAKEEIPEQEIIDEVDKIYEGLNKSKGLKLQRYHAGMFDDMTEEDINIYTVIGFDELGNLIKKKEKNSDRKILDKINQKKETGSATVVYDIRKELLVIHYLKNDLVAQMVEADAYNDVDEITDDNIQELEAPVIIEIDGVRITQTHEIYPEKPDKRVKQEEDAPPVRSVRVGYLTDYQTADGGELYVFGSEGGITGFYNLDKGGGIILGANSDAAQIFHADEFIEFQSNKTGKNTIGGMVKLLEKNNNIKNRDIIEDVKDVPDENSRGRRNIGVEGISSEMADSPRESDGKNGKNKKTRGKTDGGKKQGKKFYAALDPADQRRARRSADRAVKLAEGEPEGKSIRALSAELSKRFGINIKLAEAIVNFGDSSFGSPVQRELYKTGGGMLLAGETTEYGIKITEKADIGILAHEILHYIADIAGDISPAQRKALERYGRKLYLTNPAVKRAVDISSAEGGGERKKIEWAAVAVEALARADTETRAQLVNDSPSVARSIFSKLADFIAAVTDYFKGGNLKGAADRAAAEILAGRKENRPADFQITRKDGNQTITAEFTYVYDRIYNDNWEMQVKYEEGKDFIAEDYEKENGLDYERRGMIDINRIILAAAVHDALREGAFDETSGAIFFDKIKDGLAIAELTQYFNDNDMYLFSDKEGMALKYDDIFRGLYGEDVYDDLHHAIDGYESLFRMDEKNEYFNRIGLDKLGFNAVSFREAHQHMDYAIDELYAHPGNFNLKVEFTISGIDKIPEDDKTKNQKINWTPAEWDNYYNGQIIKILKEGQLYKLYKKALKELPDGDARKNYTFTGHIGNDLHEMNKAIAAYPHILWDTGEEAREVYRQAFALSREKKNDKRIISYIIIRDAVREADKDKKMTGAELREEVLGHLHDNYPASFAVKLPAYGDNVFFREAENVRDVAFYPDHGVGGTELGDLEYVLPYPGGKHHGGNTVYFRAEKMPKGSYVIGNIQNDNFLAGRSRFFWNTANRYRNTLRTAIHYALTQRLDFYQRDTPKEILFHTGEAMAYAQWGRRTNIAPAEEDMPSLQKRYEEELENYNRLKESKEVGDVFDYNGRKVFLADKTEKGNFVLYQMSAAEIHGNKLEGYEDEKRVNASLFNDFYEEYDSFPVPSQRRGREERIRDEFVEEKFQERLYPESFYDGKEILGLFDDPGEKNQKILMALGLNDSAPEHFVKKVTDLLWKHKHRHMFLFIRSRYPDIARESMIRFMAMERGNADNFHRVDFIPPSRPQVGVVKNPFDKKTNPKRYSQWNMYEHDIPKTLRELGVPFERVMRESGSGEDAVQGEFWRVEYRDAAHLADKPIELFASRTGADPVNHDLARQIASDFGVKLEIVKSIIAGGNLSDKVGKILPNGDIEIKSDADIGVLAHEIFHHIADIAGGLTPQQRAVIEKYGRKMAKTNPAVKAAYEGKITQEWAAVVVEHLARSDSRTREALIGSSPSVIRNALRRISDFIAALLDKFTGGGMLMRRADMEISDVLKKRRDEVMEIRKEGIDDKQVRDILHQRTVRDSAMSGFGLPGELYGVKDLLKLARSEDGEITDNALMEFADKFVNIDDPAAPKQGGKYITKDMMTGEQAREAAKRYLKDVRDNPLNHTVLSSSDFYYNGIKAGLLEGRNTGIYQDAGEIMKKEGDDGLQRFAEEKAAELNQQRANNLKINADYFYEQRDNYNPVAAALALRGSSKFGFVARGENDVEAVKIVPRNRTLPGLIIGDIAVEIINKLESPGMGADSAFKQGYKEAMLNRKKESKSTVPENYTGWKTYRQSNNPQDIEELAVDCRGSKNAFCVRSTGMAGNYLSDGDLYAYFDGGKMELLVSFKDKQMGEVGGSGENQEITDDKYVDILLEKMPEFKKEGKNTQKYDGRYRNRILLDKVFNNEATEDEKQELIEKAMYGESVKIENAPGDKVLIYSEIELDWERFSVSSRVQVSDAVNKKIEYAEKELPVKITWSPADKGNAEKDRKIRNIVNFALANSEYPNFNSRYEIRNNKFVQNYIGSHLLKWEDSKNSNILKEYITDELFSFSQPVIMHNGVKMLDISAIDDFDDSEEAAFYNGENKLPLFYGGKKTINILNNSEDKSYFNNEVHITAPGAKVFIYQHAKRKSNLYIDAKLSEIIYSGNEKHDVYVKTTSDNLIFYAFHSYHNKEKISNLEIDFSSEKAKLELYNIDIDSLSFPGKTPESANFNRVAVYSAVNAKNVETAHVKIKSLRADSLIDRTGEFREQSDFDYLYVNKLKSDPFTSISKPYIIIRKIGFIGKIEGEVNIANSPELYIVADDYNIVDDIVSGDFISGNEKIGFWGSGFWSNDGKANIYMEGSYPVIIKSNPEKGVIDVKKSISTGIPRVTEKYKRKFFTNLRNDEEIDAVLRRAKAKIIAKLDKVIPKK